MGQVTDETPAADETGSHFPAGLVSRRILDLHASGPTLIPVVL